MKKEKRKKCALIATALFFAAAGCICQRTPSTVFASEAVPLWERMTLPEWRVSFSAGDQMAKLRRSHAGNRITGHKKKIYDFLAAEIQKTAAGERTSTQFTIPVKDFTDQLQYTQEQLGVSFDTKEEQQKAMGRFMEREIITNEELREVYEALLVDLPYELFWYDKAAEGSFFLSLDGVRTRDDSVYGKCLNMDNAVLTFGFLVDGYYGSEYQTNTGRIDTARKAAANAQKIVEEAAGLSDYQKLVYYRQKICALASYDRVAAQTRSPGNQNPWQLVYVFDEDSTTNVVCEGYAKAFQYLCDLTSFADDSIYSYIVTGTISGGSSEGPHMWNIVHMGQNGNYLVDVTNCDQNMIGQDEQLFLTGYASGNVTDGYSMTVSSRQVTYRYQEDMRSIYSREDLMLVYGSRLKESDVHVHTWEETQTVDATCTVPGKRITVCAACGKSQVEELPAIGHKYEWTYFWSNDQEVCTVALACRNDSSHMLAQHTDDAGLESQDVTLEVKDSDGRWKYTLHMDAKDVVVGNVLSAYCVDSETGKYRMADGQTGYTVEADGSLPVSLRENETYRLLDAEAAEAVNQEILKTVAPKKTSAVMQKGKSMRFSLSSGLDMENVKTIVYTSSKKTAAKVSTNGKITAKKAGTAVVKAKVTLKNGMVKTVSMKVKVK